MYLSIPVIIVAGCILYILGYKSGYWNGVQASEDYASNNLINNDTFEDDDEDLP